MSELDEAIQSHIDKFEDNLFTAIPATVVSFNSEAQTVNVNPVMYEAYADGVSMTFPRIDNVPVMFNGAGGGVLTFPIKVDDEVLLVFSSRNFDQWWNTSVNPSQSTTQRFNDYNDAIAILGLKSQQKSSLASVENVELKFEDAENGLLNIIKMKPDKGIEIIANETASVKLNTDKSIEIVSEETSSIKMNADKSIVINSESGASITMLADGTIDVVTTSTIKLRNSNEELVSLLSEVVGLLADTGQTTTNTMIGMMPLNSAPQLAALKSRIDTLKG